MATITFTLSDFGLQSLAPFFPTVTFVPSGPGVKAGSLFASTPVKVTPNAAGIGSVELAATDGVIPAVWYEVQIEHLQPGGMFTHFDQLDLKIRIPDGYTGPLAGLPGTPLAPNTVYVSLTPPPPSYRGWWLYAPAPGQTMPLDDPLIGELRIVS